MGKTDICHKKGRIRAQHKKNKKKRTASRGGQHQKRNTLWNHLTTLSHHTTPHHTTPHRLKCTYCAPRIRQERRKDLTMTDLHPSRSKRGKSRRHLHNSVYDTETSRPQRSRQGQGNSNERGTGGGTGATNTFTEQDHSNTRITDLPDDIPSRASSVPSSANNMNHAQPNKLESGHGGDRTQHEGTFDMQGTTTDHRRIDQPHSGVISTPSMLATLAPKQEETCQKLQVLYFIFYMLWRYPDKEATRQRTNLPRIVLLTRTATTGLKWTLLSKSPRS